MNVSSATTINVQWNLYIKTTLGTNKMWPLYTGGLHMQVQMHGKYTPGDLLNVVFISRWSLEQVSLYLLLPLTKGHLSVVTVSWQIGWPYWRMTTVIDDKILLHKQM